MLSPKPAKNPAAIVHTATKAEAISHTGSIGRETLIPLIGLQAKFSRARSNARRGARAGQWPGSILFFRARAAG